MQGCALDIRSFELFPCIHGGILRMGKLDVFVSVNRPALKILF
jgi:hypothetical protein